MSDLELSQRSESTSTSLILRAQSLDPEAWKRVVFLYTPIVVGWARAAKLQDDGVEDVVQEVFQAVAKSIDKFEMGPGMPAFRGWLWGITRHKIKDLFRTRLNAPKALGGSHAQRQFMEIPNQEPPYDSESDFDSQKPFAQPDSIAFRALELIKNDFQENTWKAFWRVTIDDAPAADVAKDLGISVGAVYTAKSRVLKHLRNELDGLT